MRLVSEAMALRISEGAGEAPSSGRMIVTSRLWREGRNANGICGSGGREGSTGVVVGRDSGLRIEERTLLSWAERVFIGATVVADVVLNGSENGMSCTRLRLAIPNDLRCQSANEASASSQSLDAHVRFLSIQRTRDLRPSHDT